MAEETIAGRYRLVEPLGRGAMSAVWAADDEELARRVAVKMLTPTAARTRFEREARAAAALSHPNIVSLYDYGDAGGRPFMVLEYLSGGSLEERLAERPLPDDDASRVAVDVAAGLAHAHERGLVHRDLKPANILFDSEGRAKIADFGIARMLGTGTLTEAGTVLGTAAYISPEQAAGEPAGPASDVYSFGVIVFRMLTGRLPFVSTNAMELVRMHRDAAPPSLAELRPDAPVALAAVATAALAKDPADRPRDGGALLAQLRGDDSTAATQVIPPPPQRGRRRSLLAAAVVAVLLLGGGAALALALGNGGGGGASTPPASLSLPAVPTTETTAPVKTLPATGTATTTASSSAPATTAATATTTAQTTTQAPTPTALPTTAPTTTAPPATTVPTTTETLPTSTGSNPTTTAAETTTLP